MALRAIILSHGAIAVAGLAFCASAFAAEPAPRWEIGEICSSSSLGAQCPRIESQNRSSLLLRWEAVPVEDRKACKESIEDTGRPSYKLMLNCIEDRQLKALQGGAPVPLRKSNES